MKTQGQITLGRAIDALRAIRDKSETHERTAMERARDRVRARATAQTDALLARLSAADRALAVQWLASTAKADS